MIHGIGSASFDPDPRGEAKPYYLTAKNGKGWRTDTVSSDRAYVMWRRNYLIRHGCPARVETADRVRLYE